MVIAELSLEGAMSYSWIESWTGSTGAILRVAFWQKILYFKEKKCADITYVCRQKKYHL